MACLEKVCYDLGDKYADSRKPEEQDEDEILRYM